ncbi:MAG: pyridoxamine 5'-phosphate oxidase [Aureisphaera sp.]
MNNISTEVSDPFEVLEAWYNDEMASAPLKYAAACVVSTIGLDGFPNARTVSIKGLKAPHLIFTTYFDSSKGLEILENNQVALTFWWDHSQRQIRIRGTATALSKEECDKQFGKRNKSAQALCLVSRQSKPMNDEDTLRKAHSEKLNEYKDNPIPRPSYWGGFQVLPNSIEFLELKESRFHNRVCFTRNETGWKALKLQP